MGYKFLILTSFVLYHFLRALITTKLSIVKASLFVKTSRLNYGVWIVENTRIKDYVCLISTKLQKHFKLRFLHNSLIKEKPENARDHKR